MRPIILDQQYLTIEALLDSKDKDGLNHSKLTLFFIDRNGAMIETECGMQYKLHTGVSMLLLKIEPVPVKSLVSKLAIDPVSSSSTNAQTKPKFPIVQFNSATKTVFGLSKFSPEDDKIKDLESLLGPHFAGELAKLHLDKDFVKNRHKMIGPFRFTRALVEREFQTKVSVAPLTNPKRDDQLNKFIYIVEVWCPEQISQGQMAAILGGGTSQRNISSLRFIDLHETTDNVFSYDLAHHTNIIGLREENTVSKFQNEVAGGDPAAPAESNLIDIVENRNTKLIEEIEQDQLKAEGNRPDQHFEEGIITKYLSRAGQIKERPEWLQSEEDEILPVLGAEADAEQAGANGLTGFFANPGARLQGLLAFKRDGNDKSEKESGKNANAENDPNFTSGSKISVSTRRTQRRTRQFEWKEADGSLEGLSQG